VEIVITYFVLELT